jgi:hypothetical protein
MEAIAFTSYVIYQLTNGETTLRHNLQHQQAANCERCLTLRQKIVKLCNKEYRNLSFCFQFLINLSKVRCPTVEKTGIVINTASNAPELKTLYKTQTWRQNI